MPVIRTIAAIVVGSAVLLGAGTAAGQTASSGPGAYPSKVIRIVTSQPGAGSDATSRLVAQGIAGSIGQPVIVENRAGVSVVEVVAKAPPDGYTLLLSASMWITPLFQSGLPYDPIRDFAPITLVASTPNILVVHPSLPAKTVRGLIALAKSHPGEINYATGTTGSATHIAAELFRSMAGINMVRVPYKNAGPAITALIGGEVQVMFPSAGSVTAHISSGRLRALGATSAKPSMLLPGMPTVAESGLPGYEASTLFGMFAPARTPPEIINRLHQEIVGFLGKPEVKEKLIGMGYETEGTTPEKWGAIVKAEITAVGKIVKSAGLRAD